MPFERSQRELKSTSERRYALQKAREEKIDAVAGLHALELTSQAWRDAITAAHVYCRDNDLKPTRETIAIIAAEFAEVSQ